MKETFLLTLSYKNEEFKIAHTETIEAKSLVELCARYPLIIARLIKKIEKKKVLDSVMNDIPF